MKIGKSGLELIKKFEGLRLIGYRPIPTDVPTIGWGSTKIFNRDVKMGEKITEEQANEQLDLDVIQFENTVNRNVKVKITQNQFDALVCFVYNIGSGAFTKSTLLRLLNQNKHIAAAEQFLRWNKSGGKVWAGLTRRRKAEKDLFLSED